jgi:hypothetical protein
VPVIVELELLKLLDAQQVSIGIFAWGRERTVEHVCDQTTSNKPSEEEFTHSTVFSHDQ